MPKNHPTTRSYMEHRIADVLEVTPHVAALVYEQLERDGVSNPAATAASFELNARRALASLVNRGDVPILGKQQLTTATISELGDKMRGEHRAAVEAAERAARLEGMLDVARWLCVVKNERDLADELVKRIEEERAR